MHKVFANVAVSLGAAAVLSGPAMAASNEAAVPSATPEPQTQATGPKPAVAPTPKYHVVASGDSLSSIAASEKLDSWRPLWDANPEITHPDLIHAGQKLVVPQGPVASRPLPVDGITRPQTAVPQQSVQVAPKQQAPAAAPKPQVQTQLTSASTGVTDILARTKLRESGGNYTTNTGNGFYGAYQFDLATWRSVGGTGLPSNASPAEQDMRAQMLYSQRGCQPWPNTCY